MSDKNKTSEEEEKLNNFIAQKSNENEALKKLLDELNKETSTDSKTKSSK